MRDIGATSPGRWQVTHFAYMIGATSALKVGAAADAGAACCGAPFITVEVMPIHTIATSTRTRARFSSLMSNTLLSLIHAKGEQYVTRSSAERAVSRVHVHHTTGHDRTGADE